MTSTRTEHRMTPDLTPQILPSGPDGLLVRFSLRPAPPAMAAAQSLARSLDEAPPEGVTEIAQGLVSVLLRFDRARTNRDGLRAALEPQVQRLAASPPSAPAPRRRWTIPAVFGGRHGPQLAELANRMGVTQDQAIRQICETELRVLTIGFAPGQPYVGLLPPAWDVPRMATLNPSVPAGAIVVALRQIVMFTATSATGWWQVAQSGFRNFMPQRDDPMPLRAGDAIRYLPVSDQSLQDLTAAPDGLGGATLERLA